MITKEIDLCKCGQEKCIKSKLCLACRKTERHNNIEVSLCSCGEPKSKKSKRCRECWFRSRREAVTDYITSKTDLCSCGAIKYKISNNCQKCWAKNKRKYPIGHKKKRYTGKTAICLCGAPKTKTSKICKICLMAKNWALDGLSRTCSYCGIQKDLEFFVKHKSGHIGKQCKKCKQDINDKWKKDNPNNAKDIWLRTKFRKLGVDPEVYLKLYHSTEKCSLCDREIKGKTKNIDHCHLTNTFRGIICRSCNLGIGMLKDSILLINNAIRFLDTTFSLKFDPDNYRLSGDPDEEYFRRRKFISFRDKGIKATEDLITYYFSTTKCGICDAEDSRLYIDHCHVGGNFRGLLCRECNSALGQFRDNTEVLARVSKYLEQHSAR